jgi:hypothetical protein
MPRVRVGRAALVLVAALAVSAPVGLGASASAYLTRDVTHAGESGWVGTRAASPVAANSEESQMSAAGFTDRTVRDIVYPAIGGRAVRVRFSNAYGKQPLVIGPASIGIDWDRSSASAATAS